MLCKAAAQAKGRQRCINFGPGGPPSGILTGFSLQVAVAASHERLLHQFWPRQNSSEFVRIRQNSSEFGSIRELLQAHCEAAVLIHCLSSAYPLLIRCGACGAVGGSTGAQEEAEAGGCKAAATLCRANRGVGCRPGSCEAAASRCRVAPLTRPPARSTYSPTGSLRLLA